MSLKNLLTKLKEAEKIANNERITVGSTHLVQEILSVCRSCYRMGGVDSRFPNAAAEQNSLTVET